jgi:cysteinyl-tRNA synthetase
MDDDFNTAAALGHLFDAVRALNRLAPADPATERGKAAQFLAGYAALDPLFGVLGLLQSPAAEFFRTEEAPSLAEEEILRRIEARKAARAKKDFAEADRIRRELDSLGVLLEDSKGGTTWKYKA